MALEHLRETLIYDPQYYFKSDKQIESNKLVESLHQKIEVGEVIHLFESLKESSKLNNLDENILNKIVNKLKESGLENSKKILWKLPVARFGNVNGNGRIYPRKLYENMMNIPEKRNEWCRNVGLTDHPVNDDDPGSIKNAGIVWLDMEIDDVNKLIYGFGRFIGPLGAMAEEIILAGGKLGLSQSGFGEVNKITKEVDPDTYIPERLADIVVGPSQKVYGTLDCPHTASEFLDNVHQGATMEFKKQPVRESTGQNIRSKIMADKFKFDAAAPVTESAPAQSNGGAQTELKESVQKKPGLSKIEEKAFRKYVERFMSDAEVIENPITRLNECMDILDCFEEGNCPDLKETLEKKLLEEKAKLEALVEKVVSTEKDFGMNIDTFRKAAERNTSQGLLLKEQVTDYKSLCESLTERNKELKEKVEVLNDKLKISEKLTERKILNANKEIVHTSTEIDNLKESLKQKADEISKLKDSIKKLSEGNKYFEKENGLLNTKLKEAIELIQNSKTARLQESEINKNAFSQIKLLETKISDLEKTNKELDNIYTIQSQRFDKLQESFDAYKKEVTDTYNPIAHMLPNSTERVGKYLNLRENKAIEIENYWADLKEQYGERIDPFEDQIRNSKTLREAVYNFLKYRNQIDDNFAIAQPAEYSYHNLKERADVYSHQGIINPVEEYKKAPVEQKNAEFLAKLKAQNLQ